MCHAAPELHELAWLLLPVNLQQYRFYSRCCWQWCNFPSSFQSTEGSRRSNVVVHLWCPSTWSMHNWVLWFSLAGARRRDECSTPPFSHCYCGSDGHSHNWICLRIMLLLWWWTLIVQNCIHIGQVLYCRLAAYYRIRHNTVQMSYNTKSYCSKLSFLVII